MTTRALRFGSVAALYERYRPNYSDELVDLVLHYAAAPVRTALEIGAGTGKATRAFASRGIAVTATDPDPAMLQELRTHVPDNVTTIQATFEDVAVDQTFDLVFAAASLHWTDQATRWARIANLLNPGGIIASFGGPMKIIDDGVRDKVDEARSPFLPDDSVRPPGKPATTGGLEWPGTDLEDSDLFTDVEQHVVARRMTMPAADYVGHLSTVSAYLELSTADLAEVLVRIHDALPDEVEISTDLTVHLARKT